MCTAHAVYVTVKPRKGARTCPEYVLVFASTYLQLVVDQVGDVSLPVRAQHVDHLPSWVRGFGDKVSEDPHQGVLVLEGREEGGVKPEGSTG